MAEIRACACVHVFGDLLIHGCCCAGKVQLHRKQTLSGYRCSHQTCSFPGYGTDVFFLVLGWELGGVGMRV